MTRQTVLPNVYKVPQKYLMTEICPHGPICLYKCLFVNDLFIHSFKKPTHSQIVNRKDKVFVLGSKELTKYIYNSPHTCAHVHTTQKHKGYIAADCKELCFFSERRSSLVVQVGFKLMKFDSTSHVLGLPVCASTFNKNFICKENIWFLLPKAVIFVNIVSSHLWASLRSQAQTKILHFWQKAFIGDCFTDYNSSSISFFRQAGPLKNSVFAVSE